MKTFKLKEALLLFGILIFCYHRNAFAQNSQQSWKEIVIGIPPTDHRNIDQLLPMITPLPGISYRGYCDEQSCVLLLFDPGVYADPQHVVDTLQTKKLTVLIKDNTTFKMIQSLCGIPPEPAEMHKE